MRSPIIRIRRRLRRRPHLVPQNRLLRRHPIHQRRRRRQCILPTIPWKACPFWKLASRNLAVKCSGLLHLLSTFMLPANLVAVVDCCCRPKLLSISLSLAVLENSKSQRGNRRTSISPATPAANTKNSFVLARNRKWKEDIKRSPLAQPRGVETSPGGWFRRRVSARVAFFCDVLDATPCWLKISALPLAG